MLYKNQNKKSGFIAGIAIAFVVVLTAFIVVSNKQHIQDLISYWQYKPSAEIANIINRAGVNDNGEFLFYASQPQLDGTQNFNQECGRTENVASILGCYKNGQIFVYDVNEDRLEGIREVTAAHEMLHAAYVRLSYSERSRVDSLTESEYLKVKDDKNLQAMIKYYDQTEPGQRANELHSIIATQFSDIDNELEIYYQKYFSNRGNVVSLYSKYIGIFNELETQQKSLESQLKTLNKTINKEVNGYNSSIQILNADIQTFNSRADNGEFVTQSQFNYERMLLMARVSELSSQRNSINSDINKYNNLLKQYNSIASVSKELYNSIDSTLAPAPSV